MRYMAYAECAFILAALLTAGIGGVTILQRRTDGAGKLMGGAALTLCAGEALSLLPRAAHRLGFLPEPGLGSLAGRMAAPRKGDRPEALAAEYDALAAELRNRKQSPQ